MVEYAGQQFKLNVETINDGWWALDKMATKRLMSIRLIDRLNGDNNYPVYIPTTRDIVNIIKKYLECEDHNDRHVFPKGYKRPAELHKKITELKAAFKEFEPTIMEDFI